MLHCKGVYKRITGFICTVCMVLGLFQGIVGASFTAYAAPNATDYANFRARYKDFLVGSSTMYNSNDPALSVTLDRLTSAAQSHWDKFIPAATRGDKLFTNLDIVATEASLQKYVLIDSFYYLREMTLAYYTNNDRPGSLYGNAQLKADILDGLEYLQSRWYNKNTTIAGMDEGYIKYIGIPIYVEEILLLLHDDLPAQLKSNYINTLNHWDKLQGSQGGLAYGAGANRAWHAQAAILRGAITDDDRIMKIARDAMTSLLLPVTSGNGFYTDGSYLEHSSYAYAGAYGQAYFQAVLNIIYWLEGSPWSVTDPNRTILVDWAFQTYLPIIYKGAMFDFVRGRDISRYNETGHHMGHAVIGNILMAADIAEPDESAELKSQVKQWMLGDNTDDYYADIWMTFHGALSVAQLMEDDAVLPSDGQNLLKIYTRVDKAVLQRPDWAFGVSAFSKDRTNNFESINKENEKGWHTSSGWTQMFLKNDPGAYVDEYYAAVDWSRLAGTTVVRGSGSISDRGKRSTSNWTGGVSDGTNGGFGFQYKTDFSTLASKKSWFMFDDEVVCVGSGIANTGSGEVETIVENFKLNENGDNALTVNGTLKSSALGWNETLTNPKYIHLEGNKTDSDIGYYFPADQVVGALRQARTGSWNDFNQEPTFVNPNNYTRNYMTLWLEHGQNPSNAKYSYVLLPNKTAAQTASYSDDPDIVILRQDSNVHAVYEKTNKMTGINFWSGNVLSVTKDGISDWLTCEGSKAAVFTKEFSKNGNDYIEIYVSDPTQENTGTITLKAGFDIQDVISHDNQISVDTDNEKITVNVNSALGQTFKTVLQIGDLATAGKRKLTLQASEGGRITSGETSLLLDPNAESIISAEASDGYAFSGWTVASETELAVIPFGDVSQESTTFTMPDFDCLVTANFSGGTQYALTVTPEAGGTIISTHVNEYHAGEKVAVSAKANAGYQFVGWESTAGQIADSTKPMTTFTMPTSSATLTAKFLQVSSGATTSRNWEFDVNLEEWGLQQGLSNLKATGGFMTATVTAGDGEVAIVPPNHTASAGEYLQIRIKPAAGATGWQLCYRRSTTPNDTAYYYTVFPFTSSPDAEGYYVEKIKFSDVQKNGTGAGANKWDCNIRDLYIQPSSGRTSGNISIDYIRILSDSNALYRIKATAADGGTVTAPVEYAHTGDKIALSAKAKTGYRFTEWTFESGSGTILNASSGNTVLTVATSDVRLKANFEPAVDLKSITLPENPTVNYGTEKADVTGGFPSKLVGILNDAANTEIELDVSWDLESTPAYSSTTPGTYVFNGNISLPAGVTNGAGINLSPNLTVTLRAQDAITYDIIADPIADAEIDVADNAAENETVRVTITVTDPVKEIASVSATSTAMTLISSSNDVYIYEFIMPAESVTISAVLKNKGSSSAKDVTSIGSIDPINVVFGTAVGSIQLPPNATATLDDSSTADLAIDWNSNSTPAYDGNTAGDYEFTGTVQLPGDGTILNGDNVDLTVTVTVTVLPESIPTYTITTTPVTGATYDVLDNSAEGLPITVTVTVTDIAKEIDTFSVTGDNSASIPATKQSQTAGVYVYHFTMPGQNVTISLTLKANTSQVYQDLQSLITQADLKSEGDHTPASWGAFAAALAQAKLLTSSDSDGDLQAAITALQQAMGNLVIQTTENPKLDQLKTLIASAKSKTNDSKYTMASRNALLQAIADAQAIANGPDNDDEAILLQAIADLQAAIKGLTKQPENSGDSNGRDRRSGRDGSGGNGPAIPAPPKQVFAPLNTQKALQALKDAIAATQKAGSATVTVRQKNVSDATLEQLKKLIEAAKGKTINFVADSMWENSVDVRINFNPKNITKNVVLSGSTRSDKAKFSKAKFEKWYKNKIAIVELDQKGGFGMTVKVAAKVNLTGFDVKNLYFYSYDAKANSYCQIKNPQYYYDKNGYIHFFTPYGGTIVIAEGQLQKKK